MGRIIIMGMLGLMLGLNVAQAQTMDTDGDGIMDDVDNCPSMSNHSQTDTDGDLIGDVCDSDADNDGVPNASDPAPLDSSIS